MSDDMAQILIDLEFITEHWEDLVDARQPGTSRPWRQALIDPDERARRAQRDREERATRDPDAPGFTSAPQHIDVLDVIVDAWVAIDELVALISPDWRRSRTGGAVTRKAAEHGPAPVTEIGPMVEFIRTWAYQTEFADHPRAGRIARRLTGITREITRVLGLVRAGQLLNGAVCPWCRGSTPKHPAGGQITMRVEEIPGSTTLGTEPAAAVVCWNPLCTPPDDQVGTWYRGRPAWPWHEWEWLADRLIIAEPTKNRSLLTETPTSFDLAPIVHSGRSGIDQSVRIEPPKIATLDGVRDKDRYPPRSA